MSEIELPNSSEDLECVDNAPSPLSLEALSVLPIDFHAQYFTRSVAEVAAGQDHRSDTTQRALSVCAALVDYILFGLYSQYIP